MTYATFSGPAVAGSCVSLALAISAASTSSRTRRMTRRGGLPLSAVGDKKRQTRIVDHRRSASLRIKRINRQIGRTGFQDGNRTGSNPATVQGRRQSDSRAAPLIDQISRQTVALPIELLVRHPLAFALEGNAAGVRRACSTNSS